MAPPGTPHAPEPAPLPQARPLPFEGAYQLSISAAASCASALPPGLRVRRYDVTILTSGERSQITFASDDVWSTDGQAYQAHASVRGGRALIEVHAAEWLRREPLANAEAFYIMARGEALPAGPSLEGRLDGTLEFLSNSTGSQECRSSAHDFYLKPRLSRRTRRA
ncbi:MAG TPA: hypothetical protein VFM88_14535 [Vicinamibacteria bacterium]|nr:hypothetical protein [Vicinamibacteria bacterium]